MINELNDPNEIIVSIDNEKYHSYRQQIHSELNSKKDKINDESQINFVLLHFCENLRKKLYKKTIKEIDSLTLGQNLDEFNNAWKIFIIRIRAQLKVIKKKIEKYFINNAEKSKLKTNINSVKNYLNKVLKNLNIFVENFLVSNKKETIEKIDNLLRCYFEYIYLYCLFNKKIGNIMEIIPYMSFLVKLYKETKLIVKSDRTLFQLEKCFLLLNQLLISNRDYDNGINYINLATKICFEHLIYNSVDLSDGIFICDKKKLEEIKKQKFFLLLTKNAQQMELEQSYGDKNIKKIIFHLIILFYYRGICYENIGKINFSIKSYYQCLWFINNFYVQGVLKISLLIESTLERCIEVKKTIEQIMKKIKLKERMYSFLKKQIEKKKTGEEDKDIMYDHLLNGKKLKKFENKILNLKIIEVDTINPFDTKKNIKEINGRKREGIYKNIFMSNVRLYNSYLREDFRPIIDGMNKIKTLDIDIGTREKMQTLMRGYYFQQKEKKNKENAKLKHAKLYYTTNISKNRQSSQSILLNANKYRTLNINNVHNTFRKIRTENYKKETLSITNTKRNIMSPRLSFRLKYKDVNKNYEKNFIHQTRNNTIRPSLSMSERMEILIEPQKYKRIFTPINSGGNHYDYKSKTIPTSLEKQKVTSQKLYETKKGSKSYRAQSVKLFKRTPNENKRSNYFFNKNYLKKRNYIKLLEDRDLKFQKNILKMKKGQNNTEVITKEIMRQNANELFHRVIGLRPLTQTDLNENPITKEEKDSKLNQKLENAIICSLENAAIIKYNNHRNIERNKSRPMTEQMSSNLKDVNTINKKVIRNIDNKLEEIQQREIVEMHNYDRLMNSNNELVKLRNEIKKIIMINKTKSNNISPSYRNIRSYFGYENNNNKEHYFYNMNDKLKII